jgi:hypothetical protein
MAAGHDVTQIQGLAVGVPPDTQAAGMPTLLVTNGPKLQSVVIQLGAVATTGTQAFLMNVVVTTAALQVVVV